MYHGCPEGCLAGKRPDCEIGARREIMHVGRSTKLARRVRIMKGTFGISGGEGSTGLNIEEEEMSGEDYGRMGIMA